jgi:hypothetical protein
VVRVHAGPIQAWTVTRVDSSGQPQARRRVSQIVDRAVVGQGHYFSVRMNPLVSVPSWQRQERVVAGRDPLHEGRDDLNSGPETWAWASSVR